MDNSDNCRDPAILPYQAKKTRRNSPRPPAEQTQKDKNIKSSQPPTSREPPQDTTRLDGIRISWQYCPDHLTVCIRSHPARWWWAGSVLCNRRPGGPPPLGSCKSSLANSFVLASLHKTSGSSADGHDGIQRSGTKEMVCATMMGQCEAGDWVCSLVLHCILCYHLESESAY